MKESEFTREQWAKLPLEDHFKHAIAFLAGPERERCLMQMAYLSGVVYGLVRYTQDGCERSFEDSRLRKEIDAMMRSQQDMELPVSGDEWKQT